MEFEFSIDPARRDEWVALLEGTQFTETRDDHGLPHFVVLVDDDGDKARELVAFYYEGDLPRRLRQRHRLSDASREKLARARRS